MIRIWEGGTEAAGSALVLGQLFIAMFLRIPLLLVAVLEVLTSTREPQFGGDFITASAGLIQVLLQTKKPLKLPLMKPNVYCVITVILG